MPEPTNPNSPKVDPKHKPARDTRDDPSPNPNKGAAQQPAKKPSPSDDDPAGDSSDGNPGTSDQKPRWEGPPENRPRGYLPAEDDPETDRDAAGENLEDPEKSDTGDALKTRGD